MNLKEDDLENIVELFGILANQKRRQMLQTCSDRGQSLAHLSRSLGMGILATKKHLSMLQKSELVEKKNGTFSTTQVGHGLIQKINSFEFLGRHKDFFSVHRFGDVSPSLIRRIGDLKECEFYYGFHLALPRWSKIARQARKYLDLIFLHPPIIIADSIKPHVDAGMKIRLLIGKNSRITECNEFVSTLDLHKPKIRQNFEKRRCGQVQVNLIMSEKEACLIFPNNEGITDMHGNFVSRNPDFVAWCHDFFEQKWSEGEAISRLR